jgi:hypothetical protein
MNADQITKMNAEFTISMCIIRSMQKPKLMHPESEEYSTIENYVFDKITDTHEEVVWEYSVSIMEYGNNYNKWSMIIYGDECGKKYDEYKKVWVDLDDDDNEDEDECDRVVKCVVCGDDIKWDNMVGRNYIERDNMIKIVYCCDSNPYCDAPCCDSQVWKFYEEHPIK